MSDCMAQPRLNPTGDGWICDTCHRTWQLGQRIETCEMCAVTVEKADKEKQAERLARKLAKADGQDPDAAIMHGEPEYVSIGWCKVIKIDEDRLSVMWMAYLEIARKAIEIVEAEL